MFAVVERGASEEHQSGRRLLIDSIDRGESFSRSCCGRMRWNLARVVTQSEGIRGVVDIRTFARMLDAVE